MCLELKRNKPGAVVSAPVSDDIVIFVYFAAGEDLADFEITADNESTILSIDDDGGSGNITLGDDGIAYAPFASPLALNDGDTLYLQRDDFDAAGWVKLTGTQP